MTETAEHRPDDILRSIIRDAQREWDTQASLTDDETKRLINDKFGGSALSFDAYMRQRLFIHLANIIGIADQTEFMKDPRS